MSVRMVVLPLELGRSVIKSMAMWDQGLWGMGSGCSKPAGICLEDLEVLQVTQFLMNTMMSVRSVDHQNLFERSWMHTVNPGCPELGRSWTCWMTRVLKGGGTNVLLGGHSVGMGSVPCVSVISVMTSHCTGATMRVVGKIGSGERGWSVDSNWRECICFGVKNQSTVSSLCEEKGPPSLSVIESPCAVKVFQVAMVSENWERKSGSLKPVLPLLKGCLHC